MNEKSKDASSPRQAATKLVTGGRDPMSYHGFVNPPVYHASTVLYRSAEDFLAHRARYQYGPAHCDPSSSWMASSSASVVGVPRRPYW
jgi:cystathionine beta-lyase/cystathionine gamma-synthase